MNRRDFVGLTGLGATALLLPSLPGFGAQRVDPARLREPGADPSVKKRLADAALNAAQAAGASYADVRLGRYLNQYVFTREKQVQNIVSTESYGVGIRVLVNGCWGFASTSLVSEASLAATARLAVEIAKADRLQVLKEPVQLAPQAGYGEVSWRTPIQQNALDVPVKQKVDLLLAANAAALAGGPATSTQPCSKSMSRSTLPAPTAPTSTRTCTASGRLSAPRPWTPRPASSARARR